MNKRHFLFSSSLALSALAAKNPAFAQAAAAKPAFIIADMHSHFGMFLPRPFGLDLNARMRESGVGLFAWAIVDDRPWTGWEKTVKTNRQTRTPQPGDIWNHFEKQFLDAGKRLAAWKVPMLLTREDLAAAAQGEPRVLLAAEAANFLEGDVMTP